MPHAATTSTSTGSKPSSKGPLRRRMHLLHRAHSLTNLGSTSITHARKGKHQHEEEEEEEDRLEDLSPLDYESASDSSEAEERKALLKELTSKTERVEGTSGQTQQAQPATRTPSPPMRPRVDTTVSSSSLQFLKERSPLSPKSRSWYEFDLAVVVALVSPIGNWLTGGDHIKNLLLVVLLIFYLHQIIEVPWSLYQKARPRRRSPQFPPDPSEPAEILYAHLAAAELRRLELFFLFCTLISPIGGAFLLRYATAAVLGQDAVSWFSTGLFVLATGMRPWAHLVDRLNERTMDLHDFIHYPETFTAQNKLREHEEFEKRIAGLEKVINRLKTNVVHATEEVYDYVDDSVGAIERSMRKQGKRMDDSEIKVTQVEKSLEANLKPRLTLSPLPRQIRSLLRFGWVLSVAYSCFRWIALATWLLRLIPSRFVPKPTKKAPPRATTRRGLPPASQAHRSPRATTRLDPIKETEEIVAYESYPGLIRPLIFASRLISRCLGLVMLPFKAVLRMVLRRY